MQRQKIVIRDIEITELATHWFFTWITVDRQNFFPTCLNQRKQLGKKSVINKSYYFRWQIKLFASSEFLEGKEYFFERLK